MNALKKTQEDLQKGRQKLDDMLQRLEREQVLTFFPLVQTFGCLFNWHVCLEITAGYMA